MITKRNRNGVCGFYIGPRQINHGIKVSSKCAHAYELYFDMKIGDQDILYIMGSSRSMWYMLIQFGRERERNVLFNDALNTFYLRLYGVRHMVKDHSDSEKGNPLPPHRLLLSISSKGSFICTIPQTG